jgi:hypothetical protein
VDEQMALLWWWLHYRPNPGQSRPVNLTDFRSVDSDGFQTKIATPSILIEKSSFAQTVFVRIVCGKMRKPREALTKAISSLDK